MEPSKPPKDVLGLGQYLVHELGFESEVDTLGRWMAHYLAELIDEAENGSTTTKRIRARKEATTTILNIWDHRLSLPGKAYPLSPYKDVLKVIDRLQPDSNPFRYSLQYAENKKEQLAAELFDGLSRLIISLLLMEIPSDNISGEVNSASIDALTDAERQLFITLQEWGDLFKTTADSTKRKRKTRKGRGNTKANLGEVAIQLVDSVMTNLSELRGELQGTD